MKKIFAGLIFMLICSGVQASNTPLLEELSQELNQGNRLYPYVLSPPIDNLPQGFVTLRVDQETYYYDNGIFFQKIIREHAYIIVPPPIGAVVFTIPQGYSLMLIDGVSLYEIKGVYYRRVLEGYKVIYPPV